MQAKEFLRQDTQAHGLYLRPGFYFMFMLSKISFAEKLNVFKGDNVRFYALFYP